VEPSRTKTITDESTRTTSHQSHVVRVRRTGGPLEVGRPFGPRYEIVSLLGLGGMGAVYQAWDSELNIVVALKVIRPEATSDAEATIEFERRFKNELLLARKVTHKNVVRIHDIGAIDGIKYITMSFVEGEDLATILARDGPLGLARSLQVARQVVAGLEAVHEASIVHRDLKPANVMLGKGDQALIMDFGIARSTARSNQITSSGLVGTLEYLAPEQSRPGVIDQRADIYATGLILYEMLLGRRTRPAQTSRVDDMEARVHQGLPGPRSVNPDIPERVDAIVTRCLKLDPADRYQTSSELLHDLSRTDDQGELIPEPRRLTRRLVLAAATVVVALAGVTYFVGRQTAPLPPAERAPVPVLIADFENQTGDATFEGAVEQTLATALEEAPYITVYRTPDARRIAAELAPDKSDRITEEVGQLIARREGTIKILLTGTVATRGSGYRLELRASDPANGTAISSVTRNVGDKGAVLGAVASMAASVREALGETETEIEALAAAETVTAGSLDAMRAYARAQELATANRTDEAITEYERAVALDPGLGRAWAGLGVIHANTKKTDRAEAAYQHAMKNLQRMTEREKFRTLGTYYLNVAQNYEKAIENFEALVKAFPADDGGHGNLALAYARSGKHALAVPEVRKLLEIYPGNRLQRYNYAMYSMYLGEFETSIAEATKLREADPAFEYYPLPLALSQLARGDASAAADTYAKLSQVNELGSSFALLGQADMEMHFGRHRTAVGLLQKGIALDTKRKGPNERAQKSAALAEALLALGQRGGAVDAAGQAVKLSRHESTLVPAARVLIQAGRETQALDIARDLENMLQRQTTAYAFLIRGEVELRKGRFLPAIEAFREAQKRYDSWLSRYLLGRAYVEAGASHAAEAIAELEECLKRHGETTDLFVYDMPTLRYLPPLYYWLARAQQDLGDAESARTNYGRFLDFRRDADADTALVADAARRLKSLGRPDGEKG
jgi:tetratricopeptide (TPR) repeat protein